MRYTKRPITIEAWRVPLGEVMEPPPVWLAQAFIAGNIFHAVSGVDINTLEGTMRANPGDWIIRGVKGELYPCEPDIFAATYDAEGESARAAD